MISPKVSGRPNSMHKSQKLISPKFFAPRFITPRLLLAFVLGTGVVTVRPAVRLMALSEPSPAAQQTKKAALQPVAATSHDIPFLDAESAAEQQLLQLANQSRQQAGAPPLTLDPGLSQAAIIHAQAMVNARELSHQFQGEPSLPERLAATTELQLDQEGENVALDYDAEHGHQHLMLSPPHRANLLNPAYNVVGLGVVRSGDRLFIVQDFGHALPNYSAAQVKERVAQSVNQVRRQANQSALARAEGRALDDAACSMAHADKLGIAPVHKLAETSTVLTYTSLHPETLPNGTTHAIASSTLHSFSIGTCYRRTDTYPTGVYWVVLSLE
jgi:uncharacterized protein YkwD